MTRRRIPCTLSSRVISSSSHSGFLGRTSTLGKIGQMALLFVHGKCQHYYESGQTRLAAVQLHHSPRHERKSRTRAAGSWSPRGGTRSWGLPFVRGARTICRPLSVVMSTTPPTPLCRKAGLRSDGG